jgi:hypothetical protein
VEGLADWIEQNIGRILAARAEQPARGSRG